MDHIEQATEQLKKNFEKVFKQKTIYKADILRLKKQASILAKLDKHFNHLRNAITTHANAMNGSLNDERRIKLNSLFEEYFQKN